MNPQSNGHGELLPRTSGDPADVIAAASRDDVHHVPAFRSAPSRPASTTALSAMSILRALHRRKALALGMAILAAGLSGPAAWFLVPRAKFKAQARLQVAAQMPKVLYQTVETESRGGEDYKRYQTTQLTLVKSQLALNAALQGKDAEGKDIRGYRIIREQFDPIFWLQENLKVEFLSGSEVMEISLSGERPGELAGIVNAVKKAYVEEVVNVDLKDRMKRHDKLKKYKEQYEQMLTERRENLRKLAETVGSDHDDTVALRQQYALDHLAYVRRDLLDVQSQKRKLQSRLNTRPEDAEQVQRRQSIPEAEIRHWVDEHPDVVRLFDRLADEEERLASQTARLRSIARAGAGDPSLKPLRVAVDATRKMINDKRAALRPVAIRELREEEQTDKGAKADDDERELARLDDLEKQLQREVNSISEGNQSLTNKTLDLQSQKDEIAQLQQSTAKVATEVEALNVELGAPPRIRTIEDAVPPLTRDDKRRFAIIGMITFGMFFGGLFGIAFLELQRQKVDSADEVPIDLGLQVVGTLPIVRARTGRRRLAFMPGESDRYSQNLLLESIDATRTMLVHAARTGAHQVVMITSAVGGEGKTSLASHLATSLARSGLRTLLIDADLRSPTIHRLFSQPLGAGLSEILRGDVEWADAITATAVDKLSILTSGRCDRLTIELLSQGRLGPLFAQLKEQFDFVIVDTSPILLVADGLIVAQHVDAALFSIFREVSSKTKIAAAAERLQWLGVRVLGAVVTGAHGGRYGNSYYNQDSPYTLLPDSTSLSSDPS